MFRLLFAAHIDYFPLTSNGGGKSKPVLRYFSKFCRISTLLLHLVNTNFDILFTMAQLVVRLPGRYEVVGSNPCLMRYIFGRKYPGADVLFELKSKSFKKFNPPLRSQTCYSASINFNANQRIDFCTHHVFGIIELFFIR